MKFTGVVVAALFAVAGGLTGTAWEGVVPMDAAAFGFAAGSGGVMGVAGEEGVGIASITRRSAARWRRGANSLNRRPPSGA